MPRLPFPIIAFVLVIIIVPPFIIWPNIREIRNFSEAIYNEYIFLEEKNRRGQDIKRAKAEYEELSQNLPKLQELALAPGEELKFITVLEKLADTNDVQETLRLNIEGKKPSGSYQTMPFQLSVHGSYIKVLRYLVELRQIPFVISIDSINIANERIGRSSDANQTTVTAQVMGQIYEYPSKAINNPPL